MTIRFAPGSRYERSEKIQHVITYDLSNTLRRLAGHRADPTIILETRVRVIEAQSDGAVAETQTNVRRYGGDNPKDKSVKQRSHTYTGQIASDAVRSPALQTLGDAGDGALDQLPPEAVTPGMKWTFSRPISIDRELGQGAMTYTDQIVRIEDRGGRRIATINVAGAGRVDLSEDLQRKGFRTSDMSLRGTAEFDLTDHLTGIQHYTAHAQWYARVLFSKIGVVFDDTYDASPWAMKRR